jgi:hypothetical protein
MTAITVTNAAWVSLGPGPLLIAAQSGAMYTIADSQPALACPGYPISGAGVVVNTTSQIWALATFSWGATVLSSPAAPTALALADGGVKTATFTGATQANPGVRGVMVIVNVSAISGAGASLVVRAQFGDGLGNFVDAPGAVMQTITATGTYILVIYPGATPQTGVSSLPLPPVWRLVYTIAGATPSVALTVSAEYLS